MPRKQKDGYTSLLERQQAFIRSGGNRTLRQRREALEKLLRMADSAEKEILAALAKDLGKPEVEAFTGEFLMVRLEILHALKKLRTWMRPRRAASPFVHRPARSRVHREGFGSVLIIAPWNYPYQLLFAPLVSALAAGNSVVLKPSELAPATARLMDRIIRETFSPEQVALVKGGVPETTALLALPFDMIFYTGNGRVGRIVMRAASEHLTPVVLELGGKSPCVVAPDADLAVSARRIAWGKFFNAGQTCVAPDYVVVHESVRELLLEQLRLAVRQFYGEDPKASPDYARIVNTRHFDRLLSLLPDSVDRKQVADRRTRFLAPVIVEEHGWEGRLMEEEIFGPILPVLSYTDPDDLIGKINARPKPLALYLFSKDRGLQKRFITETSSGGICINDTIRHITNIHLPFGGVGESGMGSYHGRTGFDTFSREKSVMRRGFHPDIRLVYPPFRRVSLRFLRILSRFF